MTSAGMTTLPRTALTNFAKVVLTESKHIGTYKGRNLERDLLTSAFKDMVPGLARATRHAHQRARSRLDTLVRHFHTTAVLRLNQARSGTVRRELALKDLKDSFKVLYYDAYKLGLEGSASHLDPQLGMSAEDRRWVDTAFVHEMRFFNRFVSQVMEGRLSPGQIDHRVRMYMDTVRSVYESGRVMGTSPTTLIYWVYNPEAQHCESCLYLRDHSPYTRNTIPTTPRAGGTECISNCKCHLRMVPADPEIIKQVEARHLSRSTMMRYLGQLKNRRSPRWRARGARNA